MTTKKCAPFCKGHLSIYQIRTFKALNSFKYAATFSSKKLPEFDKTRKP